MGHSTGQWKQKKCTCCKPEWQFDVNCFDWKVAVNLVIHHLKLASEIEQWELWKFSNKSNANSFLWTTALTQDQKKSIKGSVLI